MKDNIKQVQSLHFPNHRPADEMILQDSEAKWRSLVDNAPNFITIIDRDGKVEFINHTVPGTTTQDVIGHSVYDFVEPDFRDMAERKIKGVFESGKADYYESAALGPDNTISWYENHLGPIKKGSQVIAVTIIATEITERLKAEEKIRSLAQFPSENHNPVMRIHRNCKILYANEASAPLLAFWNTRTGQEMPDHWCQIVGDAIESGKDFTQEIIIEDRIFSMQFTPVVSEGYANLYGRDVTEQKQAEEQLSAQNRFINTVFESLSHPFYVIDANDYTIKMANTAANNEDWLESITCYALTHFRDTPCDGVEHICPLAKVKKTGKPAITEHVHMSRNGKHRNYQVHGYPIFDTDGNVAQMIEYTLDITERVRAEQALKKARDELEQRVEERTAELAATNIELQAAVNKNNALFRAEQRARHRAETLAAASLALTKTLDLQVVMNTMLEFLGQLVPYDSASFILPKDAKKLVVRATHKSTNLIDPSDWINMEIETQNHPYLTRLLSEQESILIPDIREHSDWRHFAGLQQVCSWLGIPLVADGKVIALCLLDKTEPHFFIPRHVMMAEALVSQAAVVVQNAWLFEQVRAGRERLRALSQRLVEVQETERRYIARELHDEAGQALTSLMVGLRLLERDAEKPEAIITGINELKSILDGVLENLHRLAADLRPASLDHLGLVPALRQYTEAISDRHNLVIQFEVIEFNVYLSPDIEIALYRIIQEAITNVVRHAQATRVDVLLEKRSDKIIVLVEDNGIGFNYDAAVQHGRLGLFGMRERAEMLDGLLFVESTEGGGTTLRLEVPYAHSHTYSG